MYRGTIWKSSVLLMAILGLSVAGLSAAADTGKDSLVAGHRVLKVYNNKNSSVRLEFAGNIFQDRAGAYWVSTFNGIHRFDEKSGQWMSYKNKYGYRVGSSTSIVAESRDNKLWALLGEILYSTNISWYDGNNWQAITRNSGHELSSGVSAMFATHDGRVWFAKFDKLLSYDGERWGPEVALPDIAVGRLKTTIGIEDDERYIWLGTTGGIVRFDERKREWKSYYTKEENIIFLSAYKDRQGRVWFGGLHGQVHSYIRESDSWISYNLLDHLPAEVVSALKISPAFKKPMLSVYGVYQDRNGLMMFATDEGLLTFLESEDKWEFLTHKNSGLPDPMITCITEDRSGRIWIGTFNGIVVLEP